MLFYLRVCRVILPSRTCPGCSVPEPYRSHDWALVPAKSGLQGWIFYKRVNSDIFCPRWGKIFFPRFPFEEGGGGGGELIVPVQRRTCLSVTQPNVTSSTKQSPSWDACSSSASQEITIHFMKPEGSLLRSQHLSFVHILSQINPLHNLPSNFFKNYFNIVFISSSCMCYLSGFATYSLCVSLSPIYATCPAYLILISPNLI